MKIGIFTDLRFTKLSNPTGVTKHIIQMIKGLYYDSPHELVIIATYDQLGYDGNIPKDNSLSFLDAISLPISWKTLYWSTFFFNHRYYDKYISDFDIVYCPKNDFLPLKNIKTVVTFHGAHELDPNFKNPVGFINFFMKIRSRIRYKQLLKYSALVLTVSDFLKKQLIKLFNFDENKIFIVGNGVENIYFEQAKNTIYKPDGPLLSIGGLNYIDGGDRIIEIAKYLKKVKSDKKILIAGDQHEKHLLKNAKELNNIKFLGYLNSFNLSATLSNSSFLIYLSRYETFGIAAAESMVMGIPIITTKTTAIPEVVKGAGIYIRSDFIIEDFSKIVFYSNNYEDKIISGKSLALNFKWDICVGKLINVLENLNLSIK